MFRRLLKIFFSLVFFIVASPVYIYAAGDCIAPKPNDSAINNIIQQAQDRGGAAALVPAELLKAIYDIEGTVAYANPEQYQCKKLNLALNSTALGLMQITDTIYREVVPENERLEDQSVCAPQQCKMSRCNPVDAMEIAARVLLLKVWLWDNVADKPLGKITLNKNQVYTAACNYYGSFQPDALTTALIGRGASPGINNTLTYCEYVCAITGLCSSGYPARGPLPVPGPSDPTPSFNWNSCDNGGVNSPGSNLSSVQAPHPLRPFPNQLTSEEKARKSNDPDQTLYCAQRPTVVQPKKIDKREEKITVSGNLTSDFQWFTTPFLSITDKRKADFNLPFNEKAQKYLADFLEGRAYYETAPEAVNPTTNQQQDIFNRMGVFRKLAPEAYQDQLKNAMIKRASGTADASAINEAYGFSTATTQIHNYKVRGLNLSQLQPKPIDDPEALAIWENSPTAEVWPYVPMFTREDSQGFIQTIDEPGNFYQNSAPKTVPVIHPHLARTYEVSSSLANLLNPSDAKTKLVAMKENFFTPAPWTLSAEAPWWIDSGENQAQWGGLGPVCDPQNYLTGSGDLAKESIIKTTVDKTVDNPIYDPAAAANCVREYWDPDLQETIIDDSRCFENHDVRYSPTYLKTYTPFLQQIADNLLTGSKAIFPILSPFVSDSTKPKEDWPAAANLNEENPAFSFDAGSAESGYRKPGDPAQFFYKYLGTLHCESQKILAMLQPSIGGKSATISQECLTGKPTTPSIPTGDLQLVWPSANHEPGIFTSCYGKRCWMNSDGTKHFGMHAGIDMGYGDGTGIYAAAAGIIHSAGFDSTFGYYVIINHQNGWFTIYGHMYPNLQVANGTPVDTNTLLGYQDNSGASTGSHLHFGLSRGGNTTDFFMASGLTVDPCSSLPSCACEPNQYNGLDKCP